MKNKFVDVIWKMKYFNRKSAADHGPQTFFVVLTTLNLNKKVNPKMSAF